MTVKFSISVCLVLFWQIVCCNSADYDCSGSNSCDSTSVSTSSGNILCWGYQSCLSSSISLTSSDYDVKCFGYYSCEQASFISNYIGDIQCWGPYSCASVTSYVAAYASTSIINCYGYYSCSDSQINRGNTLNCNGMYSCDSAMISYIENIYVDGTYGAQDATINSYGISGSNFYVYLRGIYAGYGASLTCQDAGDVCYLYCYQSGCNNTDLSGSGTWIVDCDNSLGNGVKECPNGYNYIGDTPAPSIQPSMTPSEEPTGGASETISCNDAYQCQYQSLTALAIDCNGYYSCRGTGNEQIQSLSSYISCGSKYSCYNVQDIISSTYVLCNGDYSCSLATISSNNNGNITCGGSYACLYSQLIGSNNDLTCSSKSSCQNSVISAFSNVYAFGFESMINCNLTSISTIYGYGAYSLSQSNIVVASSETLTAHFFGYYSGYDASIVCQASSICNIKCYGNGCDNLDLQCNAGALCSIDCDASKNIDCPNGYVGPTSSPTKIPTTIPTVAYVSTSSLTISTSNEGYHDESTESGQTGEMNVNATSTLTDNNNTNQDCNCNEQLSSNSDSDCEFDNLHGTLLYFIVSLCAVILGLIVTSMILYVKWTEAETANNNVLGLESIASKSPKIGNEKKKVASLEANEADPDAHDYTNKMGNTMGGFRDRDDSMLGKIDLGYGNGVSRNSRSPHSQMQQQQPTQVIVAVPYAVPMPIMNNNNNNNEKDDSVALPPIGGAGVGKNGKMGKNDGDNRCAALELAIQQNEITKRGYRNDNDNYNDMKNDAIREIAINGDDDDNDEILYAEGHDATGN